MMTGTFTVTAAEASAGKSINVGFEPSYIKFINTTTLKEFTKVSGVELSLIDSGAGTTDIAASAVISSGVVGTGNSAYTGVTIAASVLAENDVITYVIAR